MCARAAKNEPFIYPCSHPGTTFSLRLKSKKGEMGYIARGILSPNLIRSCPAVNAQFWSGCVHFLDDTILDNSFGKIREIVYASDQNIFHATCFEVNPGARSRRTSRLFIQKLKP